MGLSAFWNNLSMNYYIRIHLLIIKFANSTVANFLII